MLIRIEPNQDGEIEMKMIYSDSMRGILEEGSSSISRASHVEPNPDNSWSADMSPIGGESLNGFETREDALKAEVKWINDNYLTRA